MKLLQKLPELLAPPPRDAAALRRTSDANLRELIAHAWEQSRFHRAAWEHRNLKSGDIQTADDLVKLPTLTRQMIHEHQTEIADSRVNLAACTPVRTSGSTGESVAFHSTQEEVRFAHALWFSTYMKCGVRPWHRQAKFVSATSGPRKRWLFQRLGIFRRDYNLVTAPTAEKIRWLRETKPDVVFGWGSVLTEIAHALETTGERLDIPLAISSSEAIRPEQITARVAHRVADLYGSIETAACSLPCPNGRGHHIDTRWNIIELLDDNDRPAPSGRIVVTTLWRRTLPLIRYEMGDLGTWATEPCGCGNPMPLLATLDGRVSDYIEIPGRGRIATLALIVVFRAVPGVWQFQIVLPTWTEAHCRVVAGPEFPPDGEARLRAHIAKAFGENVNIHIRLVPELPRIPGQKHRSVITPTHLTHLRERGHDTTPLTAP